MDTLTFATAITALFGSFFAIVRWLDETNARKKAIAAQNDQWQRTFEKGIAEWRVQFLRDLVLHRVAVYPAVLKILGAVRDVAGGSEDEYLHSLERNRADLLRTADELLEHLYGEAGLVMSMSTRDQLHEVRAACHRFQSQDAPVSGLVNAFFYARRRLRQDIQIADSRSIETALTEISNERQREPGAGAHYSEPPPA